MTKTKPYLMAKTSPRALAILMAVYAVWLAALVVPWMLPMPLWMEGVSMVLTVLVWLPWYCYAHRSDFPDQKAELCSILAIGLLFLAMQMLGSQVRAMIIEAASQRLKSGELKPEDWWKVEDRLNFYECVLNTVIPLWALSFRPRLVSFLESWFGKRDPAPLKGKGQLVQS